MHRGIYFALVLTPLVTLEAHGQELSKQQIGVIEEFSNNICEQVKQEGSTSSEKIQGDVKAALPGFLKKLAEAGAGGQAEYKQEQYQGVLQKDLAGTLSDIRKCKQHIADDFIDRLKPQEDMIAYHLLPGSEQTPQNSCAANAPLESLILFLGSSTSVATKFPHTVLSLKGEPLITINKMPDGSLDLNLKILSEDGREIVRIEDNRFVINENNFYGMSQPEGRSSLEVVSKDRQTVLAVKYLNESAVKITGIFRTSGIFVPIDSSKMNIGGINISGFCSVGANTDIDVRGR